MSAITVSLPDGSERELSEGASAADLAVSIGPRLAADAVADADLERIEARS